jgi:hypothetical protein
VDKTKLETIRERVTTVWTQFQPAPASKDGNKTTLADGQSIDEADKFTETTATHSKLNIPKVNVDPWSAFWLVLAAIVGGTGAFSYLLLISVPPTSNCRGITPLSTDSERLYCAQVGAQNGELKGILAAMEVVKSWNEGHPLYADAQKFLGNWSKDLTKIARKQLNEGDLEGAISSLKQIPANSPTYDKTQELIGRWSEQSAKGGAIAEKFEKSLKNAQWDHAFVQLQTVQMMRGRYWNTYKHEQMSLRLAQERDGWDRLQAAKEALREEKNNGYLVGANQKDLDKEIAEAKEGVGLPEYPAPLVAAIEIANQIDNKTYVYQQGQELRSVWSKQILKLSIAKHQEKNYIEALGIAQKVPKDVNSYAEAQDWVKLNQSEASADKRHILALMDSVAQAKRIPKSSKIYSLAQGRIAQWKGLVSQQTKLQWAKSVASVSQPSALQLAIATAQQLPAGTPEGDSALSEISTWRQQIQAIDSRTTIAKAQQIVAEGESLANLRAAVHLVGRLDANVPIPPETRAMVDAWRTKLETIEDEPIIANAQAIANRGQLTEAIKVANKIAPGRALYQKAQSNIRYWSLELMEIADRRTLQRAIAVYREGHIVKAIAIGDTITRRSPMYAEARGYISNWRDLLSPKSISSLDR